MCKLFISTISCYIMLLLNDLNSNKKNQKNQKNKTHREKYFFLCRVLKIKNFEWNFGVNFHIKYL